MRRSLLVVANRALAAAFLPVALVTVARARLRRRGAKRMMLGVTPIITIRDIAAVMRSGGWTATTVVREVYPIHRRSDFDVVMPELMPPALRRIRWQPLAEVLTDYWTFCWAVPRFDVFLGAFDGRMLMRTPLRHIELQLLRLAGKRVVLLPYGSDVQDLETIPEPAFRDRMGRQYPRTPERDAATRREVAYCSRHADLVINGVDWVDFVRRREFLVPTPFYVDVDRFAVAERRGPGGPFRVGHAPNHRMVKGTDLLEEAVDDLVKRGLDIELVVIEHVPNAEMPSRLAELDVFAEQFVLGWYGLAAVEAMAVGLPVLAYLRDDLLQQYAALPGGRPPIVPTRARDIAAELEALAHHPDRRARLGAEGRAFVVAHHSRAALGRVMADVIARLYPAEPEMSANFEETRRAHDTP